MKPARVRIHYVGIRHGESTEYIVRIPNMRTIFKGSSLIEGNYDTFKKLVNDLRIGTYTEIIGNSFASSAEATELIKLCNENPSEFMKKRDSLIELMNKKEFAFVDTTTDICCASTL